MLESVRERKRDDDDELEKIWGRIRLTVVRFWVFGEAVGNPTIGGRNFSLQLQLQLRLRLRLRYQSWCVGFLHFLLFYGLRK